MSSLLASPVPDTARDALILRLTRVMPEPEILLNWPLVEAHWRSDFTKRNPAFDGARACRVFSVQLR